MKARKWKSHPMVFVHSLTCDRRRIFVQDPRRHYALDFLLLNLAIISSAVSSPFLIFSTSVRNAKPSLGSESTKRLRSAIGPRVSYCLSSTGDTSRASASFAKISSEGNRLPSSMSERKGEEMPIWSAILRKDKPVLSRNS